MIVSFIQLTMSNEECMYMCEYSWERVCVSMCAGARVCVCVCLCMNLIVDKYKRINIIFIFSDLRRILKEQAVALSTLQKQMKKQQLVVQRPEEHLEAAKKKIAEQEAQLQHTVENQRQSEAPTHLPLVPTTAEGGVTAGGSGVRPIHYNPGRPPRYHRRGARRHLYKRWTDEQLKVADILYNADASGRGSGRGFVKFHFFFLFGLLFISLNLLFTLIFRLKN